MEELVKHSVQQLGQLYGKGKSAKAHAGLALNAHSGQIPVLTGLLSLSASISSSYLPTRGWLLSGVRGRP